MYSPYTPQCFATLFFLLALRPIRYTEIAARMFQCTLRLSAILSFLKSLTRQIPKISMLALDKRSWSCCGVHSPIFLSTLLGPVLFLWNQRGFFPLNFARGYNVSANTSAVHALDHLMRSAVVSWARHLFLGHLRYGVPNSLLTWRWSWRQSSASCLLSIASSVDKL